MSTIDDDWSQPVDAGDMSTIDDDWSQPTVDASTSTIVMTGVNIPSIVLT